VEAAAEVREDLVVDLGAAKADSVVDLVVAREDLEVRLALEGTVEAAAAEREVLVVDPVEERAGSVVDSALERAQAVTVAAPEEREVSVEVDLVEDLTVGRVDSEVK